VGYLHINNLYKSQEILAFKECYALEKIHGTSAHISWNGEKVNFFAGGASHELFVQFFNIESLTQKFKEKMDDKKCIVYGEAYGGKCQGMKATYGDKLRFVAFDVQIDNLWLSVPQANDFVLATDLEFVSFEKIPATIEAVDKERDKQSIQAVRNGILEMKKREGIVLRPLFECTLNNGERVISKHKGPDFSETKSKREVDPERRQIMEDAEGIALEWVTPMRLTHVLDKLPGDKDITLTGEVIKAMVEDVMREASGEIVDDKDVRRAIGSYAAKLYKEWLNKSIRE
jgi:RNA ligase